MDTEAVRAPHGSVTASAWPFIFVGSSRTGEEHFRQTTWVT